MNKAQKQEFLDKTYGYVENQQVQDIFSSLMRELVYNQPQDPLQHMIDHLRQSVKNRLIYFLIGPNVQQNSQVAETVSVNSNFKHINMFEIFRQKISQEQWKKEQNYCVIFQQKSQSINDQEANQIFFEQYAILSPSTKGVVISGYPMSMGQLQFAQKFGFDISRLFILSYKQENQFNIMKEYCQKFGLNTDLNVLSQVYSQVVRDIQFQNKNVYITNIQVENNDPKNLVDLKNKRVVPKRNLRIMIVRSQQMNKISKEVVRNLSQTYDIAGLIQSELIDEQVDNKTELGLLMQNNRSNQPDDIMNTLFASNINQRKAKFYGWISEGYPRNVVQCNMFKNERIEPTLENESTLEFGVLKNEICKLYDASKILEVDEKSDIMSLVMQKVKEIYN